MCLHKENFILLNISLVPGLPDQHSSGLGEWLLLSQGALPGFSYHLASHGSGQWRPRMGLARVENLGPPTPFGSSHIIWGPGQEKQAVRKDHEGFKWEGGLTPDLPLPLQ